MRVKSIVYAGKADVYNMAVDETHDYIANGFITHNCDALRYFCMARPVAPQKIVEEEPVLFDPLDQYKGLRPFRRI